MQVPDPALVLLVGAAGSGKSTWAAARYRDVEVVSVRRAAGRCRQRHRRPRRVRGRVPAARPDRRGAHPARPHGRRRHARPRSGAPSGLGHARTPVRASPRGGRLRHSPDRCVARETPVATGPSRRRCSRDSCAACAMPERSSRQKAGTSGSCPSDEPPPRAVASAPDGRAASSGPRVILQVGRFPWRDDPLGWIRGIALAAADAGFAGLALMDHLIQIPQVGRAWDPIPEPWVTLGALAALGTDLELGTLCTPATFRAPGIIAKAAATLDVLSDGRAFCGLGAGWWASRARGVRPGLPRHDTTPRRPRRRRRDVAGPLGTRHQGVRRRAGHAARDHLLPEAGRSAAADRGRRRRAPHAAHRRPVGRCLQRARRPRHGPPQDRRPASALRRPRPAARRGRGHRPRRGPRRHQPRRHLVTRRTTPRTHQGDRLLRAPQRRRRRRPPGASPAALRRRACARCSSPSPTSRDPTTWSGWWRWHDGEPLTGPPRIRHFAFPCGLPGTSRLVAPRPRRSHVPCPPKPSDQQRRRRRPGRRRIRTVAGRGQPAASRPSRCRHQGASPVPSARGRPARAARPPARLLVRGRDLCRPDQAPRRPGAHPLEPRRHRRVQRRARPAAADPEPRAARRVAARRTARRRDGLRPDRADGRRLHRDRDRPARRQLR